MKKPEEKFARRRLQSSYFTTVVSIALVLFMLGLLGLLVLHSQKISNYVKENIGFTVVMFGSAKEANIIRLQKTLDTKPYIKSTKYITPEEAADEMEENLGEDFIGVLGFNPLLPSLELRFMAEYANNDSLAIIKNELLADGSVKEVRYQESLVEKVNKNVRSIGLIILGFSVMLLFISIALINNTIRLSVYANRFIIRSMKLVGATNKFIQRPFILKGLLQGMIGAIIAIGLLVGTIYLSEQQFPALVDLHDVDLFMSLFGIVIILGIILSWLSNYFAVRKYVRMKTDYLYY